MRCLLLAALCLLPATKAQLLQKPYLQLGDNPKLSSPEALDLVWLAQDREYTWEVDIQNAPGTDWQPIAAPKCRKVEVRNVIPHRICTAHLTALEPGRPFTYRVLESGKEVFQSSAHARHAANQSYRFAVVGDIANGSQGEHDIAYQLAQRKPDLVAIPGDIVYERGRATEYLQKFFPVYNADSAAADVGAPLIRSTLFVAAPGNHDFSRFTSTGEADRLAYFFYWDQPLNGPIHNRGNASVPPLPEGEQDRAAFLQAAGAAYPSMGSFSFDYGNAHWIVLDSNKEADWSSPAMHDWIVADLKASKATWKFALFHHPAFDSAKRHAKDLWPRAMVEAFQAGGVDIVFAGHVHNYQRSYPIVWNAAKGTAKLDRRFDGVKRTRPHGVIHLVTGGGGAQLYDPDQDSDPGSWQPFTVRFLSRTHSFTLVDVKDKRLTITQIARDGTELDRFAVTK